MDGRTQAVSAAIDSEDQASSARNKLSVRSPPRAHLPAQATMKPRRATARSADATGSVEDTPMVSCWRATVRVVLYTTVTVPSTSLQEIRWLAYSRSSYENSSIDIQCSRLPSRHIDTDRIRSTMLNATGKVWSNVPSIQSKALITSLRQLASLRIPVPSHYH